MLQHHYTCNSTYLLAACLQNNKEKETVNDILWTCDQKLTPAQLLYLLCLPISVFYSEYQESKQN